MSCENIDFDYVFTQLFEEISELKEISSASLREINSLVEENFQQKMMIRNLQEDIDFMKGQIGNIMEKGEYYE